MINLTTCRRLGFAFHRYQDRLPEWARRPTKKSVKKPAIQQQPHLQKHLQQLEGGDHDRLAKDIQVLIVYVFCLSNLLGSITHPFQSSACAAASPLSPYTRDRRERARNH